MNIAVAGTGYVGMSIATLLAQHNHVTAVDVIPEKVDRINHHISPIQDDYIELLLRVWALTPVLVPIITILVLAMADIVFLRIPSSCWLTSVSR